LHHKRAWRWLRHLFVLIRSQGQKANLYIRIPFFIYIPFGPRNFLLILHLNLYWYNFLPFSMSKEGEHTCNTFRKGNGWFWFWKFKKLKIGRIFSYYWEQKKTKKERKTEEEKEIEKKDRKNFMKIMKRKKMR